MNANIPLTTGPSLDPLAVSPGEAAKLAGIGRTTLYAAISAGDLRSLKIGSRRLVTIEALKEWLARAEQISNQGSENAR